MTLLHLAIAAPSVAAIAFLVLAMWWRGSWLGAKAEYAETLATLKLRDSTIALQDKMLLEARDEREAAQRKRREESERYEAIIEAQKQDMAEMEARILRLAADGVRPQTSGTTDGGGLVVQIEAPAGTDTPHV